MGHPTLDALARDRYLNLETFKKDGTGVKTPVWFVEHAGAIYVFTDGTSFKVKRIRRDGRSRVAGCDASGRRLTTAWFEATSRILDKGAEEDAAYAALRAKYGMQMALLDIGSRIAGRYGRRAMIRIDPT